MTEFKLISEIISKSLSDTWEDAKKEWVLSNIYFAESPETCLCGHFPIIELCELKNNKNGNNATVGNCCVKKFIGLSSDKIFQAVKRIRNDSGKSLNAETLELALDNNWINSWEFDFYTDTLRKRKLTEKQMQKRNQINEKIILKVNQHNK